MTQSPQDRSLSPPGPQAAPKPSSAEWEGEQLRIFTLRRKPVFVLYNDFDSDLDGGIAERAVLETVGGVCRALDEGGRQVERIPLVPPLSGAARALESLPKGSTVFNLFEGFADDPPSEVALAIHLRTLRLRSTGCPPLSLHMGLYKAITKRFLQGAGLPTAPFRVYERPGEAQEAPPFGFPAFLKPAAEDASHGIQAENLVQDPEDLQRRVRLLLERFPAGVLAEPFLPGRELNCSVVETPDGTVALPPSLVNYEEMPASHPKVLTFDAKWAEESEAYRSTPTVCPAPVEPGLIRRIQGLALEAYSALGCRSYARVDFREDREGNLQILEVNPNPDFSPSAGLAKQAKAHGWEYAELTLRVLAAAEVNEPWT